MSLLLAAEIYAGYFVLAVIVAVTAFAAYDMWCDGDAERRIQLLISDERACDELAVQLEEIRNLPEQEPWWRWTA